MWGIEEVEKYNYQIRNHFPDASGKRMHQDVEEVLK